STRWCASDGSAPQWIQVDLGATKQVTGCQLTWEYGKRSIYKYVLEGSTDGTDWKTLADYSQNESKDYDHKFNDELRYVRVRFQGASQGCWCSLWEFDVHGTKMVPPPAPVSRKPLATNLQLPEGVKGKVFAAPPAVNYPVSVCSSPDGIVYVCVDKNGSLDREAKRGAIVRLRDIDGDGEADESKLFVADVDSPRCAVWDHDRLYVMHPPHLSAFIDHDGDGHADEQKILIKDIAFGFKDRPADHTSNGVTLGIDGWLYLAIGDFGFMDAEGADGRHLQFRSGGVIRVRPDGSGMEVYSRGTRNILEVAMDPLLNGFTRDNTNDGGGWDIRIHHFSGMEHHGYPSLYMNFTDEIVAPLADYGGGSGCGALFLDEPGYPESLTNVLCTADWGRSLIYTHRLKPNGATFSVDQEPLAHIERVTDLDVDANSNIYAASWKGATFRYEGDEVGYIVKLQPEGFEPSPLPDFKNASIAELLGTLESPSHRRRLAAQRALIRRGPDKEVTAGLERLASNISARLSSRVAAVFGLKQAQGKQSHPFLQRLARNHPDIRAWAIRALADRWDELDDSSIASIQMGLGSEDQRVRLESIVAAARQGRAELAEDVAKSLNHNDRLIAHTAVQSLVKLKASPVAFAIVDEPSRSAKHSAALRVLQSLHEPSVVDRLIERLENKEASPQHRMSLIRALCRLSNLEGEWKGNSWGTRPDTSGPYYQPEEWAESAKIKAALTRELESANSESIAQFITTLTSHKVSLPKATEVLMASADSKPDLLPIAIDQLRQSRKLGDSETQFLRNVVSNETISLDLRSRATQVLLRSGDADAWRAALTQADALTKEHGENSRPVRDLRNALLRSRQLDKHIPQLNEAAEKANSASSLWAELALINLSKSKKESIRAEALSLIESGWKDQKRREQILKAIPIVDAKHLESQVREALKDSSEAIASAARIIAARWRLEPEPTPAGPQIKSLSFEEVMAAVANNPGDAKQGALVYARLDCKKCHTVEEGEALRGPYLPNVAKTYKRDQIAEAILKPNATISQGFASVLVMKKDNQAFSGFVSKESASEIEIRMITGKTIRIKTDEVAKRQTLPISMMPPGLADSLSLKEFTSLVLFLENLKK
ncbi:MAG: discoidin domain-containing protein, partial [Planctomycetota bacterium]